MCFKDVKVCHIEGRISWKGQAIQRVLSKLETSLGVKSAYILSDQGNNLKCAASLLGSYHVADVSHAIGTCLRKTFEKQLDYKTFIKLVGSYQAKCVNQSLRAMRLRLDNSIPWLSIGFSHGNTKAPNPTETLCGFRVSVFWWRKKTLSNLRRVAKSDATPWDVIELANGEDETALVLPTGKYLLQLINPDGDDQALSISVE